MIINMKEEDIKIATCQKWKISTSVPLKHIMSVKQDTITIHHMDKNMVMGGTETNNRKFSSIIYVSYWF